jgi:hypothetical protein
MTALAVGWSGVALAQVSDVQRCVWGCLHGPGKGNPASAAYNQCVEEKCAASDSAPRAQQGDPRQEWITGRTAAGIGYAGVDGSASGSGIYYFCGKGKSFLRVLGIDGGERGMIVEVDGKQFPLSFSPNGRNQPESALPYTAPVIKALQTGKRVKVLSYEAGTIVDAPLKGSGRALAQVISSC